MSTQALLACHEVSRHYGSLKAVDGASLDVSSGEVLGIGGPNGAGKTTFFDVITGVTPPTSGRIEFDGRDITEAGADEICHAGIARTFQLNAAFEHLTVLENVQVAAQFGRHARRFPGFRLSRASRQAAERALDFAGLSSKAHMTAGALPVLDRKLLMIAGAMATEPRMVFLDEPVGGLNAEEIDLIQGLVRRMQGQGVTIVLIEHVMRFLLTLSTRVLIMHHGQIIFEGPPDRVAEDATVVETYLGQGAAGRLKKHFSEGADA
ncbi:ABC transporter ATP-binding protein [Albimonas pacifica]|uniref:Amino acid/amide ABC transporter ATP-binding protein 1, HAAT family n=1 Tax=Albimonas pacifica TaxID=1114924 RepID=A0A1I3BN01_9RHOB|nr:ABC transporter ATP-binding protein [Albimonas pacifica]SFH63623.1 amino acid/amide ABC transporter ATP-binding protein 1, HAAT family [Albimonas pacifica]